MTAYCDYNAGAPIRPEAVDAVARALTWGGNPSSVHQAGRRARGMIEHAREMIGAAISARPADIVFTSGATEALHLALDGARAAIPGLSFIRSAIEHDALAELQCDGVFNVDRRGVADLAHLEDVLRAARGRPLVALMLVNNETGAIQPVEQAIDLVRKYNGLVLCDAAQAFGRLNLHAAELGADYLVLSSHKVGGPPSAGAACSSGKVRRSRVLEAMGVRSAVMDGAVRASFGWGSSDDDVDALLLAAGRVAARAREKELS